jgi:hypothetical protein
MENYIFWTVMLAVLALLSVGIAVFLRAYLGGTAPTALFFRPKSERRLEVVDQAGIDGRRKLLLIRRDDVEHLLMTGGPVDVVIETGIPTTPRQMPETASAREPSIVRRTPVFAPPKSATDSDPATPRL